MAFYENYILPHLINCACSSPPILKQRAMIVPQCTGTILEVGMGSGLNLPYYDADKVNHIWGLEPSAGMRRKASKNLAQSRIPVSWLDLPGENIPLEENSVDTVLLTCTLCTIGDWQTALKEMRRVLKSDGTLLFCEHGKADSAGVAKWQDRLNPWWRKLAGGCNLNRPMDELIRQGGFRIDKLDRFYMKGAPKFAGHLYRGEAYPEA